MLSEAKKVTVGELEENMKEWVGRCILMEHIPLEEHKDDNVHWETGYVSLAFSPHLQTSDRTSVHVEELRDSKYYKEINLYLMPK